MSWASGGSVAAKEVNADCRDRDALRSSRWPLSNTYSLRYNATTATQRNTTSGARDGRMEGPWKHFGNVRVKSLPNTTCHACCLVSGRLPIRQPPRTTTGHYIVLTSQTVSGAEDCHLVLHIWRHTADTYAICTCTSGFGEFLLLKPGVTSPIVCCLV